MPKRHLTGAQVRQIRKMRADGLTSTYVASVIGCSASAVRRIAPGRIGKVPVAPLREAFLASDKSASEVASAMGWRCTNRRREYADGSRVKRTLGLLPDVHGATGQRSFRIQADAETVALLAEAIGVMPWEVMPCDEEMAA